MKQRPAGPRTMSALGFTTEKGRKQLVIHVEPKTFDELKARAIKEQRSIRAQICDYIELGLQVDRDCEEDEPVMPSKRTT